MTQAAMTVLIHSIIILDWTQLAARNDISIFIII